jgi:hypothetical protein
MKGSGPFAELERLLQGQRRLPVTRGLKEHVPHTAPQGDFLFDAGGLLKASGKKIERLLSFALLGEGKSQIVLWQLLDFQRLPKMIDRLVNLSCLQGDVSQGRYQSGSIGAVPGPGKGLLVKPGRLPESSLFEGKPSREFETLE